ncbi:uncharacterized protein [Scyliorhinus torazame]|uniref:uncharacterized protein n=1 Tax=Scyliorhinus torazame TaxID=75743 RepID=UPI003B5B0DBE
MAGLELTEEEKFNNLEKSVKVPSAPIAWSALIPEPPEYNNIYPAIAPQISNMPETQALLGDSVGPVLPTSQPKEQKELCPTSPVSSRTRSRTAREGLEAHQKQLSISPQSPQTKEKSQELGTKKAETTSVEEKELPLVTGRDVEVLEQPGEIPRVPPGDIRRQLPIRKMRNPDPGTAAANPTIDVYFPWTPSEMMAIMTTIPDRKKSPAAFVDSLRTTISIYQADSRDLWALVQQILTPAEYRTCLNHLNYASHAALQQAYALDDDRRTQILNALNSTFQRPINLSVILDLKPKKNEDPEEFLGRFNEIYRGQSGDLLYQNGQNSPQYCAMLMHCLPPSVVTAVKCNNMNWTENDPSQMARAVRFYWKEGVGPEGGSVTKVKTEYVMKKDDLRPQQGAEMVVYQQEPQYSDFGWVDQRRGGYQTHPKGPSPLFMAHRTNQQLYNRSPL